MAEMTPEERLARIAQLETEPNGALVIKQGDALAVAALRAERDALSVMLGRVTGQDTPIALSESVASGDAAAHTASAVPRCNDCGKPLACPGEQAERIAGLESMHEETLDRAEKAEAERDALARDYAALVAVVREVRESRRDSFSAIKDLESAETQCGPDRVTEAYRKAHERAVRAHVRNERANSALLAHPLPAEDQNAPGVCQSCRVALDAVVRQTRRREGQ